MESIDLKRLNLTIEEKTQKTGIIKNRYYYQKIIVNYKAKFKT